MRIIISSKLRLEHIIYLHILMQTKVQATNKLRMLIERLQRMIMLQEVPYPVKTMLHC